MNRSKQLNRLGAVSLARWIVVTALLAVAGLCYVYLSLQLHRLGDRKKSLETELAGLRTQIVVADTSHLAKEKVAEAVALLSRDLKIDADDLWEKLGSDRHYIVLKRDVPESAADVLRAKLREENLRGIYFEHDAARLYPNGSMLCHVIGFTDFDHKGIQGVEASMDEYLHGQDGYRYIEHNRAGQEIVLYRGQERASRDGYQVHLTVDLNLQNIVENEIDAAVHEYSPEKAIII